MRRPIASLLRSGRGSSPLELLLALALGAAILGAIVLFALQSSRSPVGRADDPAVPAAEDPPTATSAQHVTCAEGGASVDAAAVDAGAEGVPTSVSGASGDVVVFTSSDGFTYRFALEGGALDAPLPLHPGTWDVSCSINPGFVPVYGSGAVFTVADPDHRYVESRPTGADAQDCAWRGPLPPSYARHPNASIREALADDGLRDSDVVEPAGYPEAGYRSYPLTSDVFRVVRDDEILARVDVVRVDGAWRFSVLGCVD